MSKKTTKPSLNPRHREPIIDGKPYQCCSVCKREYEKTKPMENKSSVKGGIFKGSENKKEKCIICEVLDHDVAIGLIKEQAKRETAKEIMKEWQKGTTYIELNKWLTQKYLKK